MTTHDKLFFFALRDLRLSPVLALPWFYDGYEWTWDNAVCAELEHCVYWFTSGGEVLYVGRTINLNRRMRGHYDEFNRRPASRKLTGIVEVADRNGELEVWAAEVPPQDVGGYNVPNEEAIKTAMIWHANPPVNLRKQR